MSNDNVVSLATPAGKKYARPCSGLELSLFLRDPALVFRAIQRQL